jgi:ribosome biogenesis GTPase A
MATTTNGANDTAHPAPRAPIDSLPVTGWYPGHMLKAGRQIQERLALVDLVVELLDARIPQTSRNPAFGRILGSKPRCLVFTKCDLAAADASRAWRQYYEERGHAACFVDAVGGTGMADLLPTWQQLVEKARRRSGAKHSLHRPLRIMIAGIPNVGKSTLVNRLVARKQAKVGPRPGVTRSQQWLRLGDEAELLDTPGVLWPQITTKTMELKLGLTGGIKDELLGEELLAEFLWQWAGRHPGQLDFSWYGDLPPPATTEEVLATVGRRRGILRAGGAIDLRQAATVLLKDYRDGRLGRATLDEPPEAEKS